jgi:hypothetical protein
MNSNHSSAFSHSTSTLVNSSPYRILFFYSVPCLLFDMMGLPLLHTARKGLDSLSKLKKKKDQRDEKVLLHESIQSLLFPRLTRPVPPPPLPHLHPTNKILRHACGARAHRAQIEFLNERFSRAKDVYSSYRSARPPRPPAARFWGGGSARRGMRGKAGGAISGNGEAAPCPRSLCTLRRHTLQRRPPPRLRARGH